MKKRWSLKRLTVSFAFLAGLLLVMPNIYGKEESKYVLNEVLDFKEDASYNKKGGFAYNGEFYLAAPFRSNSIYKSYDGKTWSKLTPNVKLGQNSSLHSLSVMNLIWDGKQFVGVSDEWVLTSQDGINWKRVAIKHPDATKEYDLADVIFNGTEYILVGQERDKDVVGFYFPGPNTFFYSKDLISFSTGTTKMIDQSMGSERSVSGLIYSGKNYVGYGNTGVTSKNGINWEGKRGGPNGHNVIWDGKQFVFAYADEVSVSKDGINWTTAGTIPIKDGYVTTIGYNGKVYICSGINRESKHRVYYSYDLKNWQSIVTVSDKESDTMAIIATKDGFLLFGNKIWSFTDPALNSPSEWAKTSIDALKKLAFIPENLFGLYRDNLTRGEACELAINYYEMVTGEEIDVRLMYSPFSDTKDEDVLKAYSLGIVSGRENGTFGFGDSVTRQDLAVIFYNTIMKINPDISDITAWSSQYEDLEQISTYAVKAVRFLNNNKVMGGSGNMLSPRTNITKEQAFIMLLRIYENNF